MIGTRELSTADVLRCIALGVERELQPPAPVYVVVLLKIAAPGPKREGPRVTATAYFGDEEEVRPYVEALAADERKRGELVHDHRGPK